MFKKLLKDIRFYLLLIGIALLGAIFLALLNFYIMPSYTRYNQGLTVPDVTKLPFTEARELLNRDGLRDSVIDRRYTASYPPDYVIDQSPSPSLIVKPGRFIYLTVNASNAPKVEVPNVVNMSLRNAQLQLKNYGLEFGGATYVSSPFKNTVLRQSVQAGISVEKGTIVSLTVSDGLGVNKVPVPKLTGLRMYEAQSKIRNAGLRTGEIIYKPDAKLDPYIVISYSPSDKDSLLEGSLVNLVVSERPSSQSQEGTENGPVNADTTQVKNSSVPTDSKSNNHKN